MRVYVAAPTREARDEMLVKAKQTLGNDILTVDYEYSEATAPATCRAPKLWALSKCIEQLSTADIIVVRHDYRYTPSTEIPMLCAKRFDIQILTV